MSEHEETSQVTAEAGAGAAAPKPAAPQAAPAPQPAAPKPAPPAGPKPGGAGPGGPGRKGPGPDPVVQVRPVAGPAGMRRRHWGVIFGFALMVLAPLAATIFYLWAVAQDQYASTTGFTVRSEERGSASDLLGGLAQFTGGSTSSDADILYEFIQSQQIIDSIDDRVDLVAHYAKNWPADPAFALWPSASIEDLLWFWQRVVRISYDQSTGLIEVRVLAFDPETAQTIAREIVRESQSMINELNATARADLMRYAQADLQEAVERLKIAREALTRFRTRTQIVDPSADIQGRMGVLNNLQQQLAEALIDYDLLTETTSNANDPRLAQASRRIDVIRARIADERENFASDEVMGADADYPTLMAEFESLIVDREFAEESYRSALAALDIARANASRQSRYLATYVPPTLPQTSEYPQRWVLTGLAALFLVMAWAIAALIFYSIRDRR